MLTFSASFFFLNVPQYSKDQTTVLLLVYALACWASFCEQSWTVTPRYLHTSVNTEQQSEQKGSFLLKVLKGKIKKRNISSCPNSWLPWCVKCKFIPCHLFSKPHLTHFSFSHHRKKWLLLLAVNWFGKHSNHSWTAPQRKSTIIVAPAPIPVVFSREQGFQNWM